MILASPKSANRARSSESIRILAWRVISQLWAVSAHGYVSYPLEVPMNEIVIVKVLQSLCDIDQLCSRHEPVSDSKNS